MNWFLRLFKRNELTQVPYGVEMHHKDFAVYKWEWENFSPKEIASKGDGLLLLDKDALDKLQAFRKLIGLPFTPNSAYRSESHNANVGGVKYSEHRKGRAFDIPIKKDMSRVLIKKIARQVGFSGIGDYNTFVHIDTGRKRFWDNRK